MSFTSLSCLSSFPASAASPPEVNYVILISVDGLSGAYLNGLLNGTTVTAAGDPYALPNFQRLVGEGAGTMYAHCETATYETLPNHVGMLTGRPRDGAAGHGWTGNGDPAAGETISANKGADVFSVFDVAHDAGLRTGLYANKSKFSLFQNSYGDKIDAFFTNTSGVAGNIGAKVVQTYMDRQRSGDPLVQFAFLHINNLDDCGHANQWGSTAWNEQVVVVDTMLGWLFEMIDSIAEMKDHTAVILTADHGEQNKYDGIYSYAVPFFVWGPGVPGGADLYELNADTRQIPDWPAKQYAAGFEFDGLGPIRSLEAGNLALSLLGLDPIPGSVFGASRDLRVPEPATMGLLAIGGLVVTTTRRRGATTTRRR